MATVDGGFLMLTLDSFPDIEIKVDKHLAGGKMAYRIGDGPIHVSPAMHDLISNADPDELQTLLARIPLVSLPDHGLLRGVLPMTTLPGGGL